MSYHHQTKPISIPVPGGKTIQEHFGIPSSGSRDISIAQMIAPSGWGEPFQTPNFDEYTLMVSGQKQIEIEDKIVILKAGESIKIERGTRVRYSNPFPEDAEYWSICTPAFTLDGVKREEEKQ